MKGNISSIPNSNVKSNNTLRETSAEMFLNVPSSALPPSGIKCVSFLKKNLNRFINNKL